MKIILKVEEVISIDSSTIYARTKQRRTSFQKTKDRSIKMRLYKEETWIYCSRCNNENEITILITIKRLTKLLIMLSLNLDYLKIIIKV